MNATAPRPASPLLLAAAAQGGAAPRRTRRRLLGGASGLLTAAALAACAGAEGTGGGAPAGRSRQPVSLSYTTFWDEQRLSVVRPAVKEFEERTGHTVRADSVPGYTENFVVQF